MGARSVEWVRGHRARAGERDQTPVSAVIRPVSTASLRAA